MSDRLPPEIEHVTDCNELRRHLLQLMKQTKQMEFKVRKEEEKIKKSGDQLVLESRRSSEAIVQQRRNEKFRLETTIETIKNKTE